MAMTNKRSRAGCVISLQHQSIRLITGLTLPIFVGK
jgi:hypothetical protein